MKSLTKYDKVEKELLELVARHPGITSGDAVRTLTEGMGVKVDQPRYVLAATMRAGVVKAVRNRNTGPNGKLGYYRLYPPNHPVTVQDAADLQPIRRRGRREDEGAAVETPETLNKPQPQVVEPTVSVPIGAAMVTMTIAEARSLRDWLNTTFK